ncbi:MAG: response regulator transcription factor [Candidatus Nanopelagicus sp.]
MNSSPNTERSRLAREPASAMASMLFLTEATIKSHLAAIYRKLEAANRAQAVSIAISEKLILK